MRPRIQDAAALWRLDLVSPLDGRILAHELVLPPSPNGVRLGPLGGFHQAEPFAAYDAILREAATNTSPFYQVLCAWRLYEGTNLIRRWLRQQCQRFEVQADLPSDTRIEPGELERMGLSSEFAEGVRKANDLFRKMKDTRNAIAHFLLEGKKGQEHVYLADGEAFHAYSIAAAVLLRYARQALTDLKAFYQKHLGERFAIGSVLPMLEHRDRFIVVDPDGQQ